MVKLLTTIVSVVLAVGGFTALWVGANLIFNQSTRDFKRFSALAGAVLGFVFMAIIDGNRLITGLVARPEGISIGALLIYAFWPVVGAIVGGGIGYALSVLDDPQSRLAIGAGCGLVVGLALGFLLKSGNHLEFNFVGLILWTLGLAAAGAILAQLRKRDLAKGALTGAFFGWLCGSFGAGTLSSNGSLVATVLATGVAGALAGVRLGMTSNPDIVARAEIDEKSRAWIFVGPAFLFYTVMLIIPAILTFFISLKDKESVDYVGLANYGEVFTDPDNFDTSRASGFFGSQLLIWGAFFLVAGLLIAWLLGRETATAVNFNGPPILPLILAGTLFSFAIFTHLRGTIINNLWWVVGVTLLSTTLGLAIAKLSDGAGGESVAKSFVFMPMAISFVGASIIWRLMMYQARNVSKDQTGVFNAIWVWLGEFTAGGFGQILIGGIFAAAALALAYAGVKTVGRSPSLGGLYLTMTVLPLAVAFRTFNGGIGGYEYTEAGDRIAMTANFVQDSPFNTFWLMLILVWIQTGFAMVILSAAIKAVPDDFIEAASMDGATDGQIFFRIVIPQIMPTIFVVGSTIMVNVMKVFDIVKVTTNGQFDTQVLANAMYQEAFLNFNRGVGAALAIVLFVAVLPVMAYNVYNQVQEA